MTSPSILIPLQTRNPNQSVARRNQSAAPPNKSAAKLTPRLVEAMQPGDEIRDTSLRGFYVVKGARGVAFKVAGDLARGRTVRMTLEETDLKAARAKAMALLAQIKAGVDPRAAAPVAPVIVLTVGAAIDRYMADMPKRKCAPKSIQFTGARLRGHLAGWLDRPIVGIRGQDCIDAHERITASAGPVAANKTLRDFRAVWNLAARQLGDSEQFAAKCPVTSVTMNEERATRDNATVKDLPGWWCRTGELSNPLRTNMHRLALLSGLRPGNLCGIRREWLDLDAPTGAVIRFPASVMKGRGSKRRPFVMPLSAAMVVLVREALERGPVLVGVSADRCEWLFPARSRDGARVIATSNWTESTLASNECGHALRHSYRTLAAAAGVPYDVAEMLVAHVLPGVGSRYVHADGLETRLRAAQEQVTAFILAACKAQMTGS